MSQEVQSPIVPSVSISTGRTASRSTPRAFLSLRREKMSRVYYEFEYGRGGIDTVYKDIVSGEWYWQRG